MNNKKEVKSLQIVKDLKHHPFLWELLKIHTINNEGKDHNYPKEQLTILINHLIHERMHGDILGVLLSEVRKNAPTVDGYKIYHLEDLELSNCPMLVGLISDYILKIPNDRTYSVKGFMAELQWTFNHQLDEEIVEIALTEGNENTTLQQNSSYNDEVELSETSKKLLSNYLTRKDREEMDKHYLDKYIISEYKRLRKEGLLHEVFESKEISDADFNDEDWDEYIKIVEAGKDSKKPKGI
ncbi:hypothetical protein [Winogradskyella pacifica]|uniref:hypothetical protein n=1 Tax=Winogradskyella pacifica TaxID=664642 RepID=UPI0015CAADFC|nr:hypothetical protein [Winogradskyella pacifica]